MSYPPLDMGFICFVCLVFPKVVRKQKETFGKTNNTKDNQRKHNKTFGKAKQNKVFKGFGPTLGYGFVFVCVCWFSRRFLKHTTNLREHQRYNRKPKKTNKHLRENKTKTMCLKSSDPPLDMFCCLCVFVVLVFPMVCKQQTQTTFRKTKQQTRQTHIQGWV